MAPIKFFASDTEHQGPPGSKEPRPIMVHFNPIDWDEPATHYNDNNDYLIPPEERKRDENAIAGFGDGDEEFGIREAERGREEVIRIGKGGGKIIKSNFHMPSDDEVVGINGELVTQTGNVKLERPDQIDAENHREFKKEGEEYSYPYQNTWLSHEDKGDLENHPISRNKILGNGHSNGNRFLSDNSLPNVGKRAVEQSEIFPEDLMDTLRYLWHHMKSSSSKAKLSDAPPTTLDDGKLQLMMEEIRIELNQDSIKDLSKGLTPEQTAMLANLLGSEKEYFGISGNELLIEEPEGYNKRHPHLLTTLPPRQLSDNDLQWIDSELLKINEPHNPNQRHGVLPQQPTVPNRLVTDLEHWKSNKTRNPFQGHGAIPQQLNARGLQDVDPEHSQSNKTRNPFQGRRVIDQQLVVPEISDFDLEFIESHDVARNNTPHIPFHRVVPIRHPRRSIGVDAVSQVLNLTSELSNNTEMTIGPSFKRLDPIPSLTHKLFHHGTRDLHDCEKDNSLSSFPVLAVLVLLFMALYASLSMNRRNKKQAKKERRMRKLEERGDRELEEGWEVSQVFGGKNLI